MARTEAQTSVPGFVTDSRALGAFHAQSVHAMFDGVFAKCLMAEGKGFEPLVVIADHAGFQDRHGEIATPLNPHAFFLKTHAPAPGFVPVAVVSKWSQK